MDPGWPAAPRCPSHSWCHRYTASHTKTWTICCVVGHPFATQLLSQRRGRFAVWFPVFSSVVQRISFRYTATPSRTWKNWCVIYGALSLPQRIDPRFSGFSDARKITIMPSSAKRIYSNTHVEPMSCFRGRCSSEPCGKRSNVSGTYVFTMNPTEPSHTFKWSQQSPWVPSPWTSHALSGSKVVDPWLLTLRRTVVTPSCLICAKRKAFTLHLTLFCSRGKKATPHSTL